MEFNQINNNAGNVCNMKYDKIEHNLQSWHERKFGRKTVDLQRSMVKLAEEVGELAKALLKEDWDNAREECADVAIITSHICRGLGSVLFDEMIKKHAILERRLENGVKEKK